MIEIGLRTSPSLFPLGWTCVKQFLVDFSVWNTLSGDQNRVQTSRRRWVLNRSFVCGLICWCICYLLSEVTGSRMACDRLWRAVLNRDGVIEPWLNQRYAQTGSVSWDFHCLLFLWMYYTQHFHTVLSASPLYLSQHWLTLKRGSVQSSSEMIYSQIYKLSLDCFIKVKTEYILYNDIYTYAGHTNIIHTYMLVKWGLILNISRHHNHILCLIDSWRGGTQRPVRRN